MVLHRPIETTAATGHAGLSDSISQFLSSALPPWQLRTVRCRSLCDSQKVSADPQTNNRNCVPNGTYISRLLVQSGSSGFGIRRSWDHRRLQCLDTDW